MAVQSIHVGAVKERAQYRVRILERPKRFEGRYDSTVYLYTLMDLKTGGVMKWWGGKWVSDLCSPGREVSIKATVRGHRTYLGRKETTVNRVVVVLSELEKP